MFTQKFTKKKIVVLLVVLGLIALIASALFNKADKPVEEETETLPLVSVTTAGEFSGLTTVSLIGTVRAFSEAAITAEQAGRVTSVPVKLGDQVRAGQVIATLENASQRAAVLQAEGSYEAALAAAAQNGVGTVEAENQLAAAKNSAVSTYKSAFGTVNNIVLTTVDQFFANPNTTLPGLRINGRGYTATLNAERIAYQTLLADWDAETRAISTESDLTAKLTEADALVDRTVALLDTFVTIFNTQDNSSRYSDADLAGFISQFSAARSSLLATESALNGAATQLVAANEGLERATLAASGGQTSAADAQVKQALGGLRAAQANLAKTIIRTPISGTVNNLSVRTGDFIGGQQQVAEVANNDALEIVTSIGEQERSIFALNDTVQIEDRLEGTVTEIAPAVDQNTGKVEVRIAAESAELKNGDTVTVTRKATTTVDTRVFVPLSAVKFEQTDGFVFLVTGGSLESRPVTLGTVRGGSVEILEGLSANESFVTDARGLQPGTKVEVSK